MTSLERLGRPGRRVYVLGLARAIHETLLRVDLPERVELTSLALDLVMPSDEDELARCLALLDEQHRTRVEAEPELPL